MFSFNWFLRGNLMYFVGCFEAPFLAAAAARCWRLSWARSCPFSVSDRWTNLKLRQPAARHLCQCDVLRILIGPLNWRFSSCANSISWLKFCFSCLFYSLVHTKMAKVPNKLGSSFRPIINSFIFISFRFLLILFFCEFDTELLILKVLLSGFCL